MITTIPRVLVAKCNLSALTTCRQQVLWRHAKLTPVRRIYPDRSFSTTTSSSSSPIVELREYDLNPEHAVAYMQATAKAADLRKSFVPLKFFCLPETGGQLHVATHAYYYPGGHAERNEKRAALAGTNEWKDYLSACRPCTLRQQSNIYIEAALDGAVGLENVHDSASTPNKDCILELRRYKLVLGYDTVPKFLSLYESGLPSKLAAPGTHPSTSLITLLYSDVGRVNEVIEVWRHGDGTASMEQSRHAARSAENWKAAIAGIAGLATEFTSTIHKPVAFSPLK